jgi:hypothetical protein
VARTVPPIPTVRQITSRLHADKSLINRRLPPHLQPCAAASMNYCYATSPAGAKSRLPRLTGNIRARRASFWVRPPGLIHLCSENLKALPLVVPLRCPRHRTGCSSRTNQPCGDRLRGRSTHLHRHQRQCLTVSRAAAEATRRRPDVLTLRRRAPSAVSLKQSHSAARAEQWPPFSAQPSGLQ